MPDADEVWKNVYETVERYGLVDDRAYEATADIFNYLIDNNMAIFEYPKEGEEDGTA